uniref:ABC transporter ATP-binding protein n=1 Tax=Paractinoplanes polyasparticus TaxID=2856853 RepID=UPI001C85C25E|nr:ABC transporter ATP-binding protein [Actinoplanes polyasparticus]
MTPVIQLIGVHRSFSTDPPVHALTDINLSIAPGDYISIVGPSGSGKSTLLNVLGLLDKPDSGSYTFEGIETAALNDRHRTALRGARIGFVFQSFHLMNYRSVVENVMVGGLYAGLRRPERRRLAIEALTRVGLEHRRDFLPTRLSGGERQRVAIARALLDDPALLLCDEPTGNLDSVTTGAVLDLFEELRAQGTTLLVITHDNNVARRAQRRLRMQDGRLTELATDAPTVVLPQVAGQAR